jgi:hypothetical protein
MQPRKPIDPAYVIAVAPCQMCGAKRGQPCVRVNKKMILTTQPHTERERLVGLMMKAYKKAGEVLEPAPAD